MGKHPEANEVLRLEATARAALDQSVQPDVDDDQKREWRKLAKRFHDLAVDARRRLIK